MTGASLVLTTGLTEGVRGGHPYDHRYNAHRRIDVDCGLVGLYVRHVYGQSANDHQDGARKIAAEVQQETLPHFYFRDPRSGGVGLRKPEPTSGVRDVLGYREIHLDVS